MTAFSNGTEFEIWSANWCGNCAKDDGETVFCPILDTVFCDSEVPPQWSGMSDGLGDYHCSQFEER